MMMTNISPSVILEDCKKLGTNQVIQDDGGGGISPRNSNSSNSFQTKYTYKMETQNK